MVYKISWESGWLPWQPNLGHKIALISSLQEIGKFIACTGAVQLQYANRIFKGANGVAMATKFEQK